MQFQKDINHLVAWSIKWVTFYILGPPISMGTTIWMVTKSQPVVATVRDLSVTIDSSCLKFHDHTGLTITKANRILGLIIKYLSIESLIRLEPIMLLQLPIIYALKQCFKFCLSYPNYSP